MDVSPVVAPFQRVSAAIEIAAALDLNSEFRHDYPCGRFVLFQKSGAYTAGEKCQVHIASLCGKFCDVREIAIFLSRKISSVTGTIIGQFSWH